MDSNNVNVMPIIHYWSDFGVETIDFTISQGLLYKAFPTYQLACSPSKLKKGSINAQYVYFTQFRKVFPRNTIHICHLSFNSNQPRRFVIIHQYDQYFLGPDNGFLPLAFEDEDVDYYIIDNKDLKKSELSEVYIPAIEMLMNSNFPALDTIFRRKEVMVRPISIKPVITQNQIRCNCIYIDLMGNMFFNLSKTQFEEIRNGRKVKIRTSMFTLNEISNDYDDVPEGHILALFSWGEYLQIAQNMGNASYNVGMSENAPLLIDFYD